MLWDVASSQPSINPLTGQTEEVADLTVDATADHFRVAVADQDGVLIWDLDPDSWLRRACGIAGRDLTEAEWERYIGDLQTYRRTCADI